MPSNPLVLAFDTSAAHCAAALLLGDTIVDARTVEMPRGQGEYIMGMLETLLADHDYHWRDLSRIGVGVGPGNFTGIRISVSAARGLALALDIPAIGVSTFDTILLDPNATLAAVPGPRDTYYTQMRGQTPVIVAGDTLPSEHTTPATGPQFVANIARCAAAIDAQTAPPPAPLYVRAADAAPASDPPPVILAPDTQTAQ